MFQKSPECPILVIPYFVKSFVPKWFENFWNGQFWPKLCILNFFEPFWCEKTGRNSGQPILAKTVHSKFFEPFWCKKTGRKLEWPNLDVPDFSNRFGAKRLEEIRNGQFWPKLSVLNFFEPFFGVKRLEEFRMAKTGCSNFF